MAFGGWGFNPDPMNVPKKEKPDRDEQLENLLGNLLVAKYQVARLEDKVTQRVYDGYKKSTFVFKNNDTWYKVSINIDKQEPEKKEPEEFKCSYCDEKFATDIELGLHHNIHAPSHDEDEEANLDQALETSP